jgi:hypothetical protein
VTLPRDRAGFSLRGLNMTRIETFTDAAFAFALTMLVISMDPPASMTSLETALRHIPAFVLSASMLMTFWSGHHNWSRRFGLDDGPTIVLSCLLVFTMLVYVYPLRFMFSSMTAWIGSFMGLPIGPPLDSLGIRGMADVNAHAMPVAGWVYALLAVVMPLYERRSRRLLDAARARSGTHGTDAARDGAVFAATAPPE